MRMDEQLETQKKQLYDDMEEIKMRFGGDLEDVTERLEVCLLYKCVCACACVCVRACVCLCVCVCVCVCVYLEDVSERLETFCVFFLALRTQMSKALRNARPSFCPSWSRERGEGAWSRLGRDKGRES